MFEYLHSAGRTMTTLRSCWASTWIAGRGKPEAQRFHVVILMVWQSNGVGSSVSFRQRQTKPCTRSDVPGLAVPEDFVDMNRCM
jgi:hypothetical protein